FLELKRVNPIRPPASSVGVCPRMAARPAGGRLAFGTSWAGWFKAVLVLEEPLIRHRTLMLRVSCHRWPFTDCSSLEGRARRRRPRRSDQRHPYPSLVLLRFLRDARIIGRQQRPHPASTSF